MDTAFGRCFGLRLHAHYAVRRVGLPDSLRIVFDAAAYQIPHEFSKSHRLSLTSVLVCPTMYTAWRKSKLFHRCFQLYFWNENECLSVWFVKFFPFFAHFGTLLDGSYFGDGRQFPALASPDRPASRVHPTDHTRTRLQSPSTTSLPPGYNNLRSTTTSNSHVSVLRRLRSSVFRSSLQYLGKRGIACKVRRQTGSRPQR